LELATTVSVGLALLALYLPKLPPLLRRGADQQRAHPQWGTEERPTRERVGGGAAGRIAWAGFTLATTAVLGYLVAPRAEVVWFALLAIAIASVPAAAAVSLLRRPVQERDADDGEEPPI
jgi:hypothetical protein